MSEPRMRKVVFEYNTDFKGKITRQRKQFMEYFLKALSSTPESFEEAKKELMEYGVKVIAERDAGDDIAIMINGDRVYRG